MDYRVVDGLGDDLMFPVEGVQGFGSLLPPLEDEMALDLPEVGSCVPFLHIVSSRAAADGSSRLQLLLLPAVLHSTERGPGWCRFVGGSTTMRHPHHTHARTHCVLWWDTREQQ